MNPRQALVSALHLFVLFVFFGAAMFFLALPYLPEVRFEMVDLLNHRLDDCTWIGIGLSVMSFFLFLGFYALNRGRYLVLKMGVQADLNLVRQSIEECFARQFPQKMALRDLEIGSKSCLEVTVALTPIEEKSREELYILVERRLGALLRDRFGYQKPFYLVVQ
jgi:hypothetical protein